MAVEIIKNVVSAEIAQTLSNLPKPALQVLQKRNKEGNYDLVVFTETKYDVFISYATEDLDLCVQDLIKGMWRHGITSIFWDRMSIDVSESIPQKVDEGLSKSRYILCVLTEAYFNKFWTRAELDAVMMQHKPIIPVWVDTNFDSVKNFSPTLASKKAFIYNADPDEAIQAVAKILSTDKNTRFFHETDTREEKSIFWGMVFLYITWCLDLSSKTAVNKWRSYDRRLPGWRKHVEEQLSISKSTIISMSSEFPEISGQEITHLITAVLKRASNNWFPTLDEEINALRISGLSDW